MTYIHILFKLFCLYFSLVQSVTFDTTDTCYMQGCMCTSIIIKCVLNHIEFQFLCNGASIMICWSLTSVKVACGISN